MRPDTGRDERVTTQSTTQVPPTHSHSSCFGAVDCSVDDIKLGQNRDIVVSELKTRGCHLKLDPSEELEDDLVIPSDRERYAYHEVIFDRHMLVAVWSYSPYYASAEEAFSRFYDELVSHSSPDKPGDKAYDALGQRHLWVFR